VPIVLALVIALGLLAAGCRADTTTPDAKGSGDTSAAARKVTVAGDSISIGFGAALRPVVGSGYDVKVIGEEGTGLARPDRFDWPARLQKLAKEFPPATLIFSVGSNDAQDLTDPAGKVVVPFTDTANWDAEYSRRLAASFDTFAGSSTTVVWVGHVRTTEDRVGLVNRHIHALAKAVAATRPFVRVADLADLLHTGEDRADRCLMPDGLHLTSPCLTEAAAAFLRQLAP
jgi:hypothetical protein